MTIVTYTVRGRWPFPTDMLRHDDSHAATPEDQATIDMLSTEHLPAHRSVREMFSVNLVMPDAGATQAPNSKRWRSFLWELVRSSRPSHT